MTKLTGTGIFTWGGAERRSDRYGAFVLDNNDYGNTCKVRPRLDDLTPLIGKHVRITATVLESRQSGHIGDLFHGFSPSTPDVGETVALGVGTLRAEPAGWGDLTQVVLEPEDGRTTFWFDPRKLYRLHDQTVQIDIEESDAAFTPAPDFAAIEKGAISNGDNTLQVKGAKPASDSFIAPDVVPLGDGMFRVSLNLERGACLNLKRQS